MEENKNFTFRDDDFVLVHENVQVKDTKFDTKATTFWKDALKRFAKNKSSVVAAYILGIIIFLAFIIPVISDKNITEVRTTEAFLEPKLFEAGTGFWDGTREKKRIVYDTVNEVPAVSDKYSVAALKNSIISMTVDEQPTLVDVASAYASGGSIVLATDAAIYDKNCKLFSKNVTFTANGNYKLDFALGNEEDVQNSKLGFYRIYLAGADSEIVLLDWNNNYYNQTINISNILQNNGIDTYTGKVTFEVRSSNEGYKYILLEGIKLTAETSVSNTEMLEAVSFNDSSKFILVTDKDSMEYWACTGRKGIHNAELYYCDYVIDVYELVYGCADPVTYSATELQGWIDAGWCTYDYKVGPESFVKLSEECPIEMVAGQTLKSVTKKLSTIDGVGYNYKKYGYSKMPKFLVGTDSSGFDVLKKYFNGLRISFLLAFCTFLICFPFGLVWGSISGYFGGAVDLWMERFCEILADVPGTVVFTLAILLIGNNFKTFVLALCLTGWMGTAGRTRSQFYRFKRREYVLASRTLGASDARLIFKHILPNAMGTIITGAAFMIPGTISSEASLAYLGIGLKGLGSFGVMMSDNQQYLATYPYLVIFSAVIMALIMISFNLFSNGLRDAFNPQLKGAE